jgi:sugar transferase (PEP-CTERM/EpsH1 system associated)
VNILMVCPNIPSPTWGASARNFHVLRALASKHTVSLVALGDYAEHGGSAHAAALEGLTRTREVIAPCYASRKRWRQLRNIVLRKADAIDLYTVDALQEAITRTCAHGHYDAVLFESVFMAGYRVPHDLKVIVDQHNIEYELMLRAHDVETAQLRKWYYAWEGSRLKPVELERCHRADAVLVTSERDRLALQALLPASLIEVVPNGVDTHAFGAVETGHEVPGRIIFTGSMDYYPNVHAACYFAETCWPLVRARLPEVTWQIVGRNPPPRVRDLARLPGVTVTGAVPDTRPYMAAATVAIAPLLIGSGTRLKILEALAMGKAMVSTTRGCEGLAVSGGEHLEVADDPAAFAGAVTALIADPGRRQALARAGRRLVETRYDWATCTAPLLRLLEPGYPLAGRAPALVG